MQPHHWPVQVFTSNPWVESWGHFHAARLRLVALLERHRPKGLLLLSGDVHFSEAAGPRPPEADAAAMAVERVWDAVDAWDAGAPRATGWGWGWGWGAADTETRDSSPKSGVQLELDRAAALDRAAGLAAAARATLEVCRGAWARFTLDHC